MDAWLAQFESLQNTLPGASLPWLSDVREQALATASKIGFPSLRDEAWKYTNIAPIKKRQFKLPDQQSSSAIDVTDLDAFRFDGLQAHEMVFINGCYSPQHSSDGSLQGVELENLSGWLNDGEHSLDLSNTDDNVFASLNKAFLSDGVILHVADNVVLEKPIHIIFVSTETEVPVMSAPRVELQLGENAQATVIESYTAIGSAQNLTNAVTRIKAGDNSQLQHYRLQDESKQAYHVGNVFVEQQRSSRIVSHSIAAGASLSRADFKVNLIGSGAETTLNGLFMISGRQHADHHLLIEHLSPQTHSDQFFKGVLDDTSRGVFNGKVIVHENAQKIEALQSNKNLLLSRHAEIDTKPELEIYADDVKCAHGATVGQLNETELFYLRSRGIGEEKARALLTYAFAHDVIERMQLLPIKEYLEHKVVGQLSSLDDGTMEQNLVQTRDGLEVMQ